MTVYSINKQAYEQANMTPASGAKSAVSAEDAFAAALQSATLRFGAASGEVNAGAALKEHFDRPAPEARETRAPERDDRADARPAARNDDGRTERAPRQETKPSDRTERSDDKVEAEPASDTRDSAKAEKPAAQAKKDAGADQDQGDAAQATAPTGTVAAPAEAQPQVAPVVVQPAATQNADAAAQTEAQDPFAWLEQDHGTMVADLEAKIEPGDTGDAGAGAMDDAFLAQVKAAASGQAKNTHQMQGRTEPATDTARQQADNLADLLAGTGAAVKIQVSDTTAQTAAPDTGADVGALAELLKAQDLAAQDMPAAAMGQNGAPAGQNGQGVTTAGQQIAQNGALDTVQAAAGKAVEAKPFVAALAAQVEAGNGQNAQAPTTGNQAVAGLNGVTGTQAAQKATAAQAPQAARQPHMPEPKQVMDQVKVNIDKAVKDGHDTIKVELKPVDLGKIEIKLEVSSDGRVTGHVTAENKDTLAVLQKDARGLEKALQDAGLKADEGSLSFSLTGDGQQAQQQNGAQSRAGRRRSVLSRASVDGAEGAGAIQASRPRLGGRSGVDIQV